MQIEEHLDVQLGVARRVDHAPARLWQQVALVRRAGQNEASLLEEVCCAGGQEDLHDSRTAWHLLQRICLTICGMDGQEDLLTADMEDNHHRVLPDTGTRMFCGLSHTCMTRQVTSLTYPL